MQNTSDLYKRLWASNNRRIESRLIINDDVYSASEIKQLETDISVFGDSGNLTFGKCPARTLNAKVIWNGTRPPDRAIVRPQMRLTDGTEYSEWLSKGVFFIDKKTIDYFGNYMTVTAYDAMLFLEQPYVSNLTFPALDTDIVEEIAESIEIALEPRSLGKMRKAFMLEWKDGWTMRDALGKIAGLYVGCFMTNDTGELRLLSMADAPSARVLGTEAPSVALSVGGVLIGV